MIDGLKALDPERPIREADKPSQAKIQLCPFWSIADKRGCNWIVRFVPLATDAPQQTASLFDHLVGEHEQLRWHIEAKHLGGLEIDHELELRRLLNQQVGGPSQKWIEGVSCAGQVTFLRGSIHISHSAIRIWAASAKPMHAPPAITT